VGDLARSSAESSSARTLTSSDVGDSPLLNFFSDRVLHQVKCVPDPEKQPRLPTVKRSDGPWETTEGRVAEIGMAFSEDLDVLFVGWLSPV
jgi:hypothetical protein